MTRYALAYAHVSSNVGDIALNAGLARALESISDVTVVPVLARASAGLIAAASSTFPGLDTSPHVLSDEDLTASRLRHYCHHPEDYFEDLGLEDCDGVILHAGEHLFSPPELTQLHPLALWRLLPVLAAQATGRRTVILPSTFGPFRRKDPLSGVIGQALKNADAVACRETISPSVVRKAFRLRLPALLDPAFFLSHDQPPAGPQAPLGVTMRLENAGLRTGSTGSQAYAEHLQTTGFDNSEAFQFSRELIDHYLGADSSRAVDLYIQGRADEDLHVALHDWATATYGDRVRLQRPEGLEDYRAMLRSNSAVVAARFHACILAMSQGVPAWGVHMASHGHKMLGLFDQLEASDRVVTIDSHNAASAAHGVAASLEDPDGTQTYERLARLRQSTSDWLAQSLHSETTRSSARAARAALADLSAVSEHKRRAESPPLSPEAQATKDERRRRLAAAPFEPYTRISAGELNRRSDEQIQEWLDTGWTDRGADPIPLSPPIDWGAASSNRQWEYRFHSWEFLGHALASPVLSQQAHVLQWAVDVVRDWDRAYPLPTYDTEFPWYDMAIAWRTHRLAFLVDVLARSSVSDSDFDLVMKVLDVHLDALADDRNFAAHSNHGFYVAAAQVAASSRLTALPNMTVHADQARRRLRAMISQQFGEDGMHREHSPDYHRMVIDSLRELVKNFPEHLHGIRGEVRRSEDALAWLITPDGSAVPFGDSLHSVIKPSTQVFSPALRNIITSGKAGTPPLQHHQGFPDAGYWCVRDRWPTHDDASHESYLAQTAAFHSRTHKHADDLSLVWWDRGQEILIDPGRFGYLDRLPQGHPLWEQGFYYGHPARLYVESTAGHNTVEIDERSYQRRGVKPYGSALQSWGSWGDMHWSVCHVRQLESVDHRRVVVFVPGAWLLVIDHLEDNQAEHLYRQHFHFAPELQVTQRDGAVYLSHPQWTQDLTMVSASDAVPLPLYHGSEDPMMGWISRKDRTLEPAWSTGFEVASGPNARFATLLAFGDGTIDWSDDSRAGTVTWTVGKDRFRCVIARASGEAHPIITRL